MQAGKIPVFSYQCVMCEFCEKKNVGFSLADVVVGWSGVKVCGGGYVECGRLKFT